MLSFEFFMFLGKSLIIGFFVLPLIRALSLFALQMTFIIKKKLPLSGMKWGQIVPSIWDQYWKFMFLNVKAVENTNKHGSIKWNGIFKWEIK